MKFVQVLEDIWHLVDENSPVDACLIATLKGPVEVLAIKRFCETFLQSPEVPLGSIIFAHDGHSYEASPFRDRGNKLSLRVFGADGSLRRIETEFGFPNGA